MRILLLGDINSTHLHKWANSLSNLGEDIGIFSISALDNPLDYNSDITIISNELRVQDSYFLKGTFSKIKYLKLLPALKRAIKSFQPDILHAHYASSYGLLGSLSKFHPFCISVWGSDIYNFPHTSIFAKKILKSNLNNADKIFSTSFAMLNETIKYTEKEIEVIPFGVDIGLFKNTEKKTAEDAPFVIGTIKTLEKEYGIEILIKSFHILVNKFPKLPLKLLIVGKGSLEVELKQLSKDLGIENSVQFPGYISPEDVPKYHNKIDIFVCLSHSESFGVSVVEAMATGKPVVVSDIGGLPEVVLHDKTGFVVESNNPNAAAFAIEKLLNDWDKAVEMGKNGRLHVLEKYNWNLCVQKMIDNYSLIL